jgi:hypothetical protein
LPKIKAHCFLVEDRPTAAEPRGSNDAIQIEFDGGQSAPKQVGATLKLAIPAPEIGEFWFHGSSRKAL